jgi:hypothetical protein
MPGNGKSVWGPPTWRLMHTLAAKIREDNFHLVRDDFIQLINRICDNLPCPECRAHAMQNIRTANLRNINSKSALIDFLYTFHNRVNASTGKPIFRREDLDIYNKYSTLKVVNAFIETYNRSQYNVRMMADAFHRSEMMKWLTSWLQRNGQHFNG